MNQNLTLFVGGLNAFTDQSTEFVFLDGLKRYFETFGEVSNCKIILDEKGKSKRFAFVTFTHKNGYEKAIVKKHIIDNNQVDVKPSTFHSNNKVRKVNVNYEKSDVEPYRKINRNIYKRNKSDTF